MKKSTETTKNMTKDTTKNCSAKKSTKAVKDCGGSKHCCTGKKSKSSK